MLSRAMRISKTALSRSKYVKSSNLAFSQIKSLQESPTTSVNSPYATSCVRKFSDKVNKNVSSSAPKTPSYFDFTFETLTELQQKACETYPDNNAFGTRKGDKYDWITYREFGKLVDKTRTVLSAHDVKFDSKIAVISNNRVEWAALCYGVQGLGGSIVPMYEAQLESDWKYIIEDSDASVLVVSTEAIYEKTKAYANSVGKVRHVLCLDAPEAAAHSFRGWLKKAESMPPAALAPNITPDTVSTIIYTSGTTGKPKGVELSHRNIASDAMQARFAFREHFAALTSLCFLPWAHVYGLTSEMHCSVSAGSAMAIVPHRDQLLECLSIVRPSLIVTVPMLFNRVHDGIIGNLKKQSAIVRGLFQWGRRVARRRNEALEMGRSVSPLLELQFKAFDKIVFSKIREKLGGNLKFMTAGGAATAIEVLQFFEDIGIPIVEGYGLTETSPMISVNHVEWSNRRLGTVGPPLKDCDIRIVDAATLEDMPHGEDGEIVVSGPNVMLGYRNNPQANDEVFVNLVREQNYVTQSDAIMQYSSNRGSAEPRKYFRTGDMGRIVDGKFLKITGRIKEQFKLENGKYVVPAPLEDVFQRGPLIAQCCLYGANKPHTILLVVPNFVELRKYAVEHKLDTLVKLIPADIAPGIALPLETAQAIFDNEDFVHLVTREVAHRGKGVKAYERPALWTPLPAPFSQENQMMTPKLSLRRNNVIATYASVIDNTYAGHRGAHRVEYDKHGSGKK